MTSRFPEQFLWGAATSAYQIEGSPLAGGAGPTNWHRYSHTPGRVYRNQNGDLACDHYRRYREDVGLMRELGLNAYRFSIAWSRIFPEGTGRVNEAGLDFYKRLTDELRAAGITPMATLFHWDLPASLDDRGGWLNRDSAGWFADYAQTVFRALDDRVAMWATLNEPWVVTDAGFLHGVHAPGHVSTFEAAIAAHNLMRAHGAAMSAYRAMGRNQIGIVLNLEPKYAASGSAEDKAARDRSHVYMNEQYVEPLFRGRPPKQLPALFGEAWTEFPADDFREISQRIDFLGINYYKRGIMKHDPSEPVAKAGQFIDPLAAPHTELEWEVFPRGLTEILLWVKEQAGDVPLYVTENGAAFYDPPAAENGRIDDPLRCSYLRRHIGAVGDAIAGGADVRGYFVWSLLDNFEWSAGYSKRFGLVHVNYATQERTVKASGRYYADVIRTNGEQL
jgi:beta-glucosidase